jgi:hypothetical protein
MYWLHANERDNTFVVLLKLSGGVAVLIGSVVVLVASIRNFKRGKESHSWPTAEATITSASIKIESGRQTSSRTGSQLERKRIPGHEFITRALALPYVRVRKK